MPDFFRTRTVAWEDDAVRMIDQTALPARLVHVECRTPAEVATAIKRMVVRGAPAIGVAAAMGVALAAARSKARTREALLTEVESAASLLRSTRPTAVNLFWGIDRVLGAAMAGESLTDIKDRMVAEVKIMADEDVRTNMRLGKNGAALLEDGDTVLTQCNAGSLATVGYGTALGVIRAAVRQGKLIKVVVPETRPALQGARLTAYELTADGIACTLIPDTAVGHIMKTRRVDRVIVGADRITRDGYVFNKIGTYQEAVLAKRHGIPFFPAAPRSTFDLRHTSKEVVIEERGYEEVVSIRGRRIAPKGIPVANPAFDSTPPNLVTAIITERGVIGQPLAKNIKQVMS